MQREHGQGVRASLFAGKGFFFNFFSDMKEIALGAKYIWTDSQRVYLPQTSARQANLHLIWGGGGGGGGVFLFKRSNISSEFQLAKLTCILNC